MKEKTAYVSARFALKEKVKEIYSKLEKLGYSIPWDWTEHKPIKPYNENPELAKEYTIEDINGSKDSNIFIMITDEAGTGMHTELGAAIVSALENKEKLIYLIGENLDRSVFFFHPTIRKKGTIEEVIRELKDL